MLGRNDCVSLFKCISVSFVFSVFCVLLKERHFPFQDFLLICSYFLLYLQPGYLKFNFFDPSKSYIDIIGKEEFNFIFFSQLSQDFRPE